VPLSEFSWGVHMRHLELVGALFLLQILVVGAKPTDSGRFGRFGRRTCRMGTWGENHGGHSAVTLALSSI